MKTLLIKNVKHLVTCDTDDRVLNGVNVLVQDGIITVEVGAEKAGMSVDDFTREMKQAGYVIPAV